MGPAAFSLVDRDRLADLLREDVFGHETILPLAFNPADSLSEKNCLRGALVAASEHVIAHTKNTPRRNGVLRSSGGTILLTLEDRPAAASAGIDHQAVRDAFSLWQKRATSAFHAAQEEAGEGIQHSGKDYTDDVLYILAKYLESLSQVPPRLTDQWMWQFENDLWV